MDGRFTQRSGKGRETHLEVQEGSRVPPGVLGRVERPAWRYGRPTRRSGEGRETHPEVREGSGDPP